MEKDENAGYKHFLLLPKSFYHAHSLTWSAFHFFVTKFGRQSKCASYDGFVSETLENIVKKGENHRYLLSDLDTISTASVSID